MSSSIIEAKFQALDRTVRLLTKSKVASSDHLRELVYGQQQKQLHHINSKREATGPASQPLLTSVTGPQTTRKGSAKAPRCQSGNDRSGFGLGWIDPKQQRAQQILEDTWNEIEAAIQIDTRYRDPGHEIGKQTFPSTLMRDHDGNIPSEEEASVSTFPDPAIDPHGSLASECKSSQVSSNNNSPKPERRTRQRSQPLQERPAAVERCQSADATNSNHLLRGSRAQMTQLPCPDQNGRPRRLKNWFAPSSTNGNQLPPRRKRPTVTPDKQNQPSGPGSSVLEEIQSLSLRPSSMESLFSGENATYTPQQQQQSNNLPLSTPATAKIDDPSFYYLEVRLEHPLSLVDWHFHVTFTDVSISQRPSVDFDDLSVDHENCLLFPAKEQNNDNSRFFNPTTSFAHVAQPRDLYGHWIHILVRSTHPIARVVIDTSVHFGLSDEVVPVSEPKREDESRSPISQAAPDAPETRNSIHKPTKPRSATSLDHSDRRNRRAKSSIHARQQPSKPRAADEDPEDLSPDEYKPWDADVHARSASDHEILAPLCDSSNDMLSAESNSSPLSHAGISTIDKKKIQLHALRSSMRKKLHEETHRLTRA